MSTLTQFATPMTHDTIDVIASGTQVDLVLDMVGAHEVMTALRAQDVRRGGCWLFTPNVWQRFDRPWSGPDSPEGAQLMGSVYVTHGAPTAYQVTINRCTVTPMGEITGWTPEAICNAALRLAGISIADCGSISIR